MSPTRTSAYEWASAALLIVAGIGLWLHHARAWDLGHGSPILGYDAAQYALAARELSEHGRLATGFALPIELARHPAPPWPLALVQPGLVGIEAALLRFDPADRQAPSRAASFGRSERLLLSFPIACFMASAVVLALVTCRILARHAPGLSPPIRAAAGLVAGAAFLLDPESQHFAAGGFTELPFTLGLIAALSLIALGWAERRPFAFGLLLGLTGSFRGSILWLAPVLAAGVAQTAPPGTRVSAFTRVMMGFAVPLAPWWLYKWRTFGSPAWDLSWLSLWDGVQGRTWFSLNHLPDLPSVPHGPAAAAMLAAKVGRNLPALLLLLLTGPRALFLGAIPLWAIVARPPRALAAAALTALSLVGVSLLAAAASVPLSRYLYPARVAGEAAGLLALWGLISRAPQGAVGPGAGRVLRAAVASVAIAWGGLQTARGAAEARAVARERGVPTTQSMVTLATRLGREVPAGEPVMSNLGPILAWYARRPVVHLALAPGDLDACRRRLDMRHVLLVFREPAMAWPGWEGVLQRPEEAVHNQEWNIARARPFRTEDGFLVLWLELGPLGARLAAAPSDGMGPGPPGGETTGPLLTTLRAFVR